jgi:hypothetical protein
MRLKPLTKLAYEYITAACDNAGIWEVHFELAEFKIGTHLTTPPTILDWDEIFDELNRVPKGLPPTVKKIEEGAKWWLVRFVAFHEKPKLRTVARHVPIFRSLVKHGVYAEWCGWYPDMTTLEQKQNPPIAKMAAPIGAGPVRSSIAPLRAKAEAIEKEINRVKMDVKNMIWDRNEQGQRISPNYRLTPEALAKISELTTQREDYVRQISIQRGTGKS